MCTLKCFRSAGEGLRRRPTGCGRSKPSAAVDLRGNIKRRCCGEGRRPIRRSADPHLSKRSPDWASTSGERQSENGREKDRVQGRRLAGLTPATRLLCFGLGAAYLPPRPCCFCLWPRAGEAGPGAIHQNYPLSGGKKPAIN